MCDSESHDEGDVFQSCVAQDAEGVDGNDDEAEEEEEVSQSLAADGDLDAFLEEWSTLDTKARKAKFAGSVLFSIDLEHLGMDRRQEVHCCATVVFGLQRSTGKVWPCTLQMYPVGTSQ